MLRKLLLITVLSMTVYAQAILLKDGSSAPYAKVNSIYYALKSLQYSPKCILIPNLQRSCNQNGTPKKLTFLARNVRQEINEKELLETAVVLGFCDKDGTIDEETAHIIRSSVHCLFKGCMPLCIDVYSPISWWAWTEIFKKASTKK